MARAGGWVSSANVPPADIQRRGGCDRLNVGAARIREALRARGWMGVEHAPKFWGKGCYAPRACSGITSAPLRSLSRWFAQSHIIARRSFRYRAWL